MTCHVGFCGKDSAVMFSDSQGSTSISERHGWQKQFVGPDFLLGVAGAGAVLEALYAELGQGSVSANNVEDKVVAFINDNITATARGSVQIILISLTGIKIFSPGMFTKFNRASLFGTIGSGSEFVSRVLGRDQYLGIDYSKDTMVDMLILSETLMNAANESLTVDDQFFIGFLCRNNSYMIGHDKITPRHGPLEIRSNWRQAAGFYLPMLSMLETMRSEMRQAQLIFSSIRLGRLSQVHKEQLGVSNQALAEHRQQLTAHIKEYMNWYDNVLGRSISTTSP